ncbi:MAG: glycosyltransferase family 4 protein [Cyanobacteriota bacterium]|nr:glycosyltransferase family 4 protein [Cyanobacteriota bacterium]
MLVFTHPTGNANSKSLLKKVYSSGILSAFYTTISIQSDDWFLRYLAEPFRQELLRRNFEIPGSLIKKRYFLECARLIASRMKWSFLTQHEIGWASIDKIYQDLDRYVASDLDKLLSVKGVYAYEDGALQTFYQAKQIGIACFYDLPIAYWETSQSLLNQEAQRLPEWEFSLVGTRNSLEKLNRKTEELQLSDVVICPSKFVRNSLPLDIKKSKMVVVSEFGSPTIKIDISYTNFRLTYPKLRVLFAGSLSQRKGLADLFAACRILNRSDIELVVLGSALAPLSFYRSHYPNFIYEPPRPHPQVLSLMQTCHVLVLPSIVEGRALVQQEAMSCGLPLIITSNTGGEDLIEDGKTGFLVSIRSPEAIAEKIAWFADHRDHWEEMSQNSREKAAQLTWDRYSQIIVTAIQEYASLAL